MSDLTSQALVIPEWLLARHDLSLTARTVWAYIAMRQGRHATGWPSVARMEADLGVNRKRIMRAVTELEGADLVTVHRKNGAKNRYSVVRNQSPEGTGPTEGPVTKRDGNQSRNGTGPVPKRDGTGPETGPHNPSNNPSNNPSSEPFAAHEDPQGVDEQVKAFRRLFRQGYANRFAGATPPPAAMDPQAVAGLACWFAERARSNGETWGAVALRTVEAWGADEWVVESRWPIRHLAKYADRYESGQGWGGRTQRGVAQVDTDFGDELPASIWEVSA